MEGIGLVLGGLALAIALASLWFVNDVTRRVEDQNKHFFDTHIKGISDAVERVQERLARLERSRIDGEKLLQNTIQEAKTVAERMHSLEALLQDTRQRLEHLDNSIDSRFRRTDPPPKNGN